MEPQLDTAVPQSRPGSPRCLDLEQLKQLAGHELGVSAWHEVTQEAINAFADATGDHQFKLTLDAVRDFPGGATLALTLAFERATSDKPVCVANVLYRVFDGEGKG
jgi:hypothetical protein